MDVPKGFLNLPEKLVEIAHEAVKEIARDTFSEWKVEAGRKLNTSADAYKDSIQMKQISEDEIEVYMQQGDDKDHWLPNSLERGYPSFSMRDGFLKKAKIRQRTRSNAERKKMFAYLKSVGRLGQPATPYAVIKFPTPKGSSYRSVSKNTPEDKWKHPGFKPLGEGGLDEPIREYVIKYATEQVTDVFSRLFASVKI